MNHSAASDDIQPTSANAGAQRHHNEGHGRRLTAAFEALEAFPALAESRNRVLRLLSEERLSGAEVVSAVESDVRQRLRPPMRMRVARFGSITNGAMKFAVPACASPMT